jgi:hypothetical protein
MSIERLKLAVLTLVVAFAASACTDLPTAESTGDRESVVSPEPSGSQASAAALASNPRFLGLAREFPGFGGAYLREDGRMAVYMAEGQDRAVQSREDLVGGIARALTAQGRSVSASQIALVAGDHDLLRLSDWHQRASHLLTLDGVVFTAVDQSRNRLRVGVVDEASRSAVVDALGDLDIPLDAVIMDRAEPFVALDGHTLRDRVRPVAGGLQIAWEGAPGSFFACTLGANVLRPNGPGRNRLHFLTNSHCTRERGVVHGTQYWQNLPDIPPFSAEATTIGFEVLDPPFFTSAENALCPEGRNCRFSDAALAEYSRGDGAAASFASIYRTKFFGTGNAAGSLEIEEERPPRFRIVDDVAFPVGGETLDKMGRTTGWTRGEVILACATVNVAGTNVTMICQDIVQAAAAGGDSGSPVFMQIGDTRDVHFYGLLWGGGAIGGQLVHVFSAASNIAVELGAFQTH